MALNAMKPLRRDYKLPWVVRRCRSAYRQDDSDKSPHQLLEEGKKPRIIHGQEYPEWRKQWGERKGEFVSLIKPFVSEVNPKPDVLNAMSKIPDLTWDKVKDWWKESKEFHERDNQKFLSKRVEYLGANLAAAHFILYRKGSIRWKGSSTWIAEYITDKNSTINLPVRYEDGYFVEAIDASNFHNGGLRYEGLENLQSLNFIKWFSLRNNSFIDVWGVDRIAGQMGATLEYLDISGCTVCPGCIVALSRIPNLKFLIITDPEENKEIEVALADLETLNPKLLIKYEPVHQIVDKVAKQS